MLYQKALPWSHMSSRHSPTRILAYSGTFWQTPVFYVYHVILKKAVRGLQQKNAVPRVKYAGRRCFGVVLLPLATVVLPVCMASSNPKIMGCNVGPSDRKLGLGQRSWVVQQESDPKHTSKSIHG